MEENGDDHSRLLLAPMVKAAVLAIKGGSNYDITRNTVRHKASGYYGVANLVLNNYYMHLPA